MTMSEKSFREFDSAWEEARDCFARLKRRKARIVTVRGKDGRAYRYTEPIEAADS